MSARWLIFLLLFPAAVQGQGYAGLGSGAGGYAAVTAPAALEFPRDHGAHPGFRIEWWYLTANLKGEDGEDFGAQWTLFRQAGRPEPEAEGWASGQIWMGHAALTTADAHRVAETFARGGIGQAGVETAPFRAWIDDWEMTGTDDGIGALTVAARGEDFAYRLKVRTDHEPVLQGVAGFSVKSEAGQASYYYSQPFYAVSGEIEVEGRRVAVTGRAWLDREWSSQPLAEDQSGWDWFSLHLEDGAKVMLFRLRSETEPPFLSGTWIAPDGTPTPLAPDQIAMTPVAETEVAGRRLPVGWRIEVPDFGLAVDTEPLNAQSWMGTLFPYWEGPISVTGSHDGRGYLEMTGYE